MKNTAIQFTDLGTVEYTKAYKIQLEYLNKNISLKEQGLTTENTVLFVQHPHVYTLGKHGHRSNLKISEQKLKEINAIFVQTDRGGDITYHGYGQLVIYPIVDLDNWALMTRRYIYSLEQVVINMLKEYGLNATRLENAPGIWMTDRTLPEKICAIGVRIIHGITMHGLALNVNTDLSYFDYINPCGFTDKGVTSMKKELGQDIDMREVKEKFKQHFTQVFDQLQ